MEMEMMTIYEANGYKNRRDYLNSLAEEYGLPVKLVYSVAQILGRNEDFDGLLSALEDAEDLDLGEG